VELLRQRSTTNNFNHQKRLDKGPLLGRLVLLLDEPYEGLAPVIVDEIKKNLRLIKQEGITTIIVEQNAVRALKLADRAVILDTGQIVFDGTAEDVLNNEALRAEYLAI
jgi:branched-chain amino acid transport system ATP-binding protein